MTYILPLKTLLQHWRNMIDIIITSFNEPRTIGRAIQSFLDQDLKEPYKIHVVAPDKGTLDVARRYAKKDKRVSVKIDPGRGKSYALNAILPQLKGRIVVLSDGDVYVRKNSLNFLIEKFKDPRVGSVTGRPVSVDSRKTLLGYWSHLLCDAGAHRARLKRYKKGEFLECSGYYWAFRQRVIPSFPLDVAEDTIVPFLFAEKGYAIAYEPKAEVYVSFPKNLKDFIEQKKRTAKAHEGLDHYVNIREIPRTKSFTNELLEGYTALLFPQNVREVLYTALLFPVRLYIWSLVFFQAKVKKDTYRDAWKRVESTKQ